MFRRFTLSHLIAAIQGMAAMRLGVRTMMVGLALLLPLGGAWAAIAPATHRQASCSWDRPGHDPFMGDVVGAVDRYTDIPADTRARLKARMAKRDYDDIADIRRDSLQGRHDYDPAIRDMHFGTDKVCSTVSRKAWSPSQHERGLVYCEGDQCIIVPTVCRNVSRVTRLNRRAVAGVAAAAPAAPEGELVFPPPAAGAPAAEPEAAPLGGGGGASPTGSFASVAGVPLIVGAIASAPTPGAETPVTPAASTGPDTNPTSYLPALVPVPAISSPGLPGIFVLTPAVPEPSTWLMMFVGLVACIARARSSKP